MYTPAFTSKHMNIVFTLLLPHLSRWKSLSILTDCWEPMYTALNAINPFITRFGAPLLESLSLIRCNDLISFSPLFQPQQLKEPEFLNRSGGGGGGHHSESDVERCPSSMMIPSLKYLSLRGVHVDWDALGDSLSTSDETAGLISLELASHSHDVRPSPYQFHKILSSSTGLRNLVLSASGPRISGEDIVSSSSSSSSSSSPDVDHYVPALLPHLRNITIGYRTAMEGRVTLGLIDAPNTKQLVLEDATYVGDPDIINAGPLLSYIGTRQFGEAHQNHRITASSEFTTTTTTTLSHHQSVPLVVGDKPVMNISCIHVNKDASSLPESRTASASAASAAATTAFPLLESVTLRGVKTCSQPLRVFLSSLSNLRHLELTRMSMQAIHALLPSVVLQITGSSSTRIQSTTDEDCYTTNLDCPCPQLRSLCIRSFEQLDSRDVDFIIGSLPVERLMKGGASPLREVDIHVDAATAAAAHGVVPSTTRRSGSEELSLDMKVNIINDVSSDEGDGDEGWGSSYGGDDFYYEDDGDDYEDEDGARGDTTGMGSLEDPFEPGGAFNDPFFDEYYSLHFQTVR